MFSFLGVSTLHSGGVSEQGLLSLELKKAGREDTLGSGLGSSNERMFFFFKVPRISSSGVQCLSMTEFPYLVRHGRTLRMAANIWTEWGTWL